MRPARSVQVSSARSRWLALFVVARVVSVSVAAALLLVHRITDYDAQLTALVVVYGIGTILVAKRLQDARPQGVAWAVDSAATLGLVLVGGDWRSPFYLLALTSLILPATTLPRMRAAAFTAAFVACYFAIAATTGVDWNTLETTSRLESFATHLLLPLMTGVGLAYAAELLRRLEGERRRSERLVVEAERRRLARELHDSAKQRIHAAHLVLSAHADYAGDTGEAIRLALREVEAATAEMDASLTDLRAPSAGDRPLDALRARAARLAEVSGVRITVDGADVKLPGPVATHVYHVMLEALINAVRHADASEVTASLAVADMTLVASIVDDGRGMPGEATWESHGMRSMIERAELIGGRLSIADVAAGTSIRLEVPLGSTGVAHGNGAPEQQRAAPRSSDRVPRDRRAGPARDLRARPPA